MLKRWRDSSLFCCFKIGFEAAMLIRYIQTKLTLSMSNKITFKEWLANLGKGLWQAICWVGRCFNPKYNPPVLARDMVGADNMRHRLHLHTCTRMVSGGAGGTSPLWRKTAHQQTACVCKASSQR